MPYIDTNKITIPRGFFDDLNTPKLLTWLHEQPTADVAPKSEVDRLEYTLLGVMHSVDKWLDGEELEQDEVNRAITMREKTLRIIENARSEVASGIMKEVRQALLNMVLANAMGENYDIEKRFVEIEKKYTEGE